MDGDEHACQLSLERSKCVQDPNIYSALLQRKLTVYLSQVNNIFRQKPIIYLTRMDKMLFAANYLAGIKKNEWKSENKQIIADSTCSHTYAGYCKFLQEHMKPAHIRQAETMVQIGNMHQQSNQSIQSLIAALSKLKEQQDSLFSNDQRMINLFLALNGKLQNEVIRFKKPCATRKELEVSAISMEKTLVNIKTLSQKSNPPAGQNCKPQSQHSNATLR